MMFADRKGKNLQVRRFSASELKQFNKPENVHVAYRGKVYDVSSFVTQHPGGVDQIMLGAGRDITTIFESYHKAKTIDVLQKYYVGELINSDVPTFPTRGAFFQTLNTRVNNYFQQNKLDPKVNMWAFWRYFLLYAMTLSSCVLAFEFNKSWIWSTILAFVWGFFSAQIATVTHDASHFSITHIPFVWKIINSTQDLFLGGSNVIWNHEHILGHHPYTNIDGFDPDSVSLNTEKPDIRRIKDSQKWIWIHKYQHIYLPVLYALLGIKLILADTYCIIAMRIATTHINPLNVYQKIVFFGGKFMHLYLRLYVPYMFMEFSTVLYINAICEATAGYWLALLLETSHHNSQVEWHKPDQNNAMNMDWAELQVASTQDWATESWFWTKFSGAINHQLAHHLFPAILPEYYPQITPIISQTCQEFGLKYHCVDSAWKAVGFHLDHLYNLGQGSKK